MRITVHEAPDNVIFSRILVFPLSSSLTLLFTRYFRNPSVYEGHLESKERFAIQRYLLIIGKKQNMQFLSHTFTYFFT